MFVDQIRAVIWGGVVGGLGILALGLFAPVEDVAERNPDAVVHKSALSPEPKTVILEPPLEMRAREPVVAPPPHPSRKPGANVEVPLDEPRCEEFEAEIFAARRTGVQCRETTTGTLVIVHLDPLSDVETQPKN
ncbi:MAG: hypothetical protein NXH97_22745 [Rhodobacteraceae bacterium]|nr:hypothetical protein [Paracoccaceae bacterium]